MVLFMQIIQWLSLSDLPVLGVRDIHVWRVDLTQVIPRQIAHVLSVQEKKKWQAFRQAEHRQRYGAAHVVLRELLGGYLGVDPADVVLKASNQGKPSVVGAVLPFNLSHSDDVALVAIAGHGIARVGVDIEYGDRAVDVLALAERFFTEEEVALIRQLPVAQQGEGFIKLWVLKEAFVKAVGCGLAGGLGAFCVQLASGDDCLVSCDVSWGNADDWCLRLLSVSDSCWGGLATSDHSDFIKYFDYISPGVGL